MLTNPVRILVLGAIVATSAIPPYAVSDEEETTELGAKMDDMNGAYRRLRRQIDDPSKNNDSIERVEALLKAAKASTKMIPIRSEDLPESKRAEFISAYQKDMDKFVSVTEQLLAALRADDNEKAVELFEKIKTLRGEGHDAYKRDDD